MVEATIPLFSYGTLQQEAVQLANYGRLIDGKPDALLGYELAPLRIADPHVVAVSGKSVHMIARPSGDPTARVIGTLLYLTQPELEASDAYEDKSYSRIEVTLESGRSAFVYAGTAADK
jgi:gamma-glutamyl AIG2-like cyclotransferase